MGELIGEENSRAGDFAGGDAFARGGHGGIGRRLFAYASPAAYVQYRDCTMNGARLLTHQDGQWDVNTMLTFSTAAGYADRVMTGE